MSDINGEIRQDDLPHFKAISAFEKMANRISRNMSSEFAGAFVIVSPNGDVKELLLLNDKPDPAMFWSNAEVTCQIAKAEIDQGGQLNPRQSVWR